MTSARAHLTSPDLPVSPVELWQTYLTSRYLRRRSQLTSFVGLVVFGR